MEDHENNETTEIIDLSKYYDVKNKYEKALQRKLKKLKATNKKVDMTNKCIFCKGNLGMTFTNKKNEDETERILSYTCNNKPSCTTYTVKVPLCSTISNELNKFQKDYNHTYDVIMRSKYNILFNYITKIEDFDVLKDNIVYYKNVIDHLLKTNQEIYNNKDRNQQLNELELNLKQILIQMTNTDNKDALFRDMIDVNQHIRDLKYSTLEYPNLSSIKTEYYMKPYNLKDFEIIYS